MNFVVDVTKVLFLRNKTRVDSHASRAVVLMWAEHPAGAQMAISSPTLFLVTLLITLSGFSRLHQPKGEIRAGTLVTNSISSCICPFVIVSSPSLCKDSLSYSKEICSKFPLIPTTSSWFPPCMFRLPEAMALQRPGMSLRLPPFLGPPSKHMES